MEMRTIKIELPATFDIAARGKSVTVDTSKLTDDIIAKLVLHGLTQKVADAAASAKKVAEESGGDASDIGKGMMQAVVTALEAGQWGTRQPGAAVSDEVKVRRSVVRKLFTAKASDEAKAAFKAMDAAKQAEHLDALFAKQSEARQAEIMVDVANEIKLAKERAEALAKLGGDFAL
jgi:hypothetical protein